MTTPVLRTRWSLFRTARRATRSLCATALVVAGLAAPIVNVFTAPISSAANPLLTCAGGTTYTMQVTGGIFSINTTSGATALAGTFAATGLNAFGVSPGGATAFAAHQTNGTASSSIYKFDVATGTTTTFSVSIATGTSLVAGAVDPANGLYYFGGFSNPGHAGNLFTIYAFDPTTNTQVGTGALAQIPALSTTGTGDLTFDSQGNVYFVQAGSGLSPDEVDSVTGVLPGTAQVTPALLSSTLLTDLGTTLFQFNGISFDVNGLLYVEYSSGGATPSVHLDLINPTTGAINSNLVVSGPGFGTGANGNVDLASCVYTGTLSVKKNIVSRVNGADQFKLSVSNSSSTLATASTTGSTTGLQSAVAGPALGLKGSSYTVSEVGIAGADLKDYLSTYSCLDANNSNAVVAAGTGTSTTFLFPAPQGASGANVTCTFTNVPGLTILKSASPTTVSSADTVVTYSFLVTNVSSVTVNSLSVVDTPSAPAGALTSGPSCPVSSLASGASTTCVGTYVVSTADISHGNISDSAIAHATPVGGSQYSSAPSAVTVLVSPSASLSIAKSASPTSVTTAGTVITYSFVVTNTGNVVMINLIVHDTPTAPAGALTTNPNCPGTSLNPGSSMLCTATYKTTQADIDNGSISDSAVVTGTPPTGPSVSSPPSIVTVNAPADAALSILKSATPTSVSTVGTVISYTFVVTNTGNVTVNNISVNDVLIGISLISCPTTILTPGATESCSGTYVVTQSDLDAGAVVNVAAATGTQPNGGIVKAPDSTFTVETLETPKITILTTAGIAFYSSAGTIIPYSFLVMNTGNAVLHGVFVESDLTGLSKIHCPATVLKVSGSMICTATYRTKQIDVKRGAVKIEAIATGFTILGIQTSSQPSGVIVPALHKHVKVTG